MADFKDYATENQLKAVENRGHNILVSASAGSGKTKVLVERIKEEILNENAKISRMLIMTFTNAAAKEMKDRLTKVLQDELVKQMNSVNKNPQKITHLQKQLTAINVADISTIDSFCLKFLKKYYYAINLDPNFRVLADSIESDVLKEDVWEKVRENFYQKYENLAGIESPTEEQKLLLQEYDDLLNLFTTDRRDDDLTEVVYQMNNFASANENPEKWLMDAVENYDFDEDTFTDTKIFKNVIKKNVLNALQTTLEKYQTYWDDFQNEQVPLMQDFYSLKEKELGKLNVKIITNKEIVEDDISKLQNIMDSLENDTIDWDDLREQIGLLFSKKLKTFSKNRDFPDDDDVIDRYDEIKANYADAKKILVKLQNTYFIYSNRQLKDVLKRAKGVVQVLINLVLDFRNEYLETKLKRHALEFSDLEYFTLKILQGDSEVSQKIRKELKLHYTEIMLDEYQDTNGVQEAIIQAIANHNVFMVGDVKQSIYRFRQADPGLFMKKYRNFKRSEESTDLTSGELIVLQENFRSVKNVAELTNLIFMQIMNRSLGEIDYDDAAFLKAENPTYKVGFEDLSADVMIYLKDSEKPDNQNNDEPLFRLEDKTQGQLVMIANKIKQLIADGTEIFDRSEGHKRKLRYSDIAILSSSHQDSLLVNDEFKRLGIPVEIDETDNYFKTTEIQIMISYLKVIDNPHQDIPLVAVLRSPMYGFDENELAYIRINHSNGDFYSALTSFRGKYENHDSLKKYDADKIDKLYEKVCQFTDDLTTFRVQSKRSELATLIWNIYTTTGFLDFVGGMPGGSQRQANLHALYERATTYEETSFKGLFQFIRFIERMDKQKNDLPEMKPQENEDTVKFMTIHKSKGLEFPVVFVTNLSTKFNLQDLNKKYVLDAQLGIGINIVESSKNTVERDSNFSIREDEAVDVQETTPINLAIKDQIKRKSLAEEMRKLYVALTRAEQQIYLVGTYQDINKWATVWGPKKANDELVIKENQRIDVNNFMDWIGQALGRQESILDQTSVFSLKDQEIIKRNIRLAFDKTSKYFKKTDIPEKIKNSELNYTVELWENEAVAFERENEQSDVDEDATIIPQKISQTLNTEAKAILDFKYKKQSLTRESAYQAVTDIRRLFNDPDNDLMSEFDADKMELISKDKKPSAFSFNKPDFLTTVSEVSYAKIGTATHLLFEKVELDKPITKQSIQELLLSLVQEGCITTEVAQKIDLDGVISFYETSLGKKICENHVNVKREVPFSLLLPAQILVNNAVETDKKILVHGIIDGYFEDQETGEVYLFDYKTDHSSLDKIKSDYKGQINLYALALESITGKKVNQRYLYSVEKKSLIKL